MMFLFVLWPSSQFCSCRHARALKKILMYFPAAEVLDLFKVIFQNAQVIKCMESQMYAPLPLLLSLLLTVYNKIHKYVNHQ